MAKQILNQGYILRDREQSAVAEAFRVLVASIQEFRTEEGNPVQTVLFTGTTDGEGCAMTAANTAVSLAYSGKRVILVDCNFRALALQGIFSLANKGVTQFVQQGAPLLELLQSTQIPTLKVLASGPTPDQPIAILSHPAMRELLDELKNLSDVVIINTSAITFQDRGVVSDACILAGRVDGVLLVFESRTVLLQTARKVLDLLSGARAKLIGCAVNDVQANAALVCPVTTN